jgi:hypothetical protein
MGDGEGVLVDGGGVLVGEWDGFEGFEGSSSGSSACFGELL